MANGTIRVYSGLMDQFTDDEVRYVIGHEIGHVKKEHTRKRMEGALQQEAALSIAGTAGGEVGELAAGELGHLFNSVISSQLSLKHE